MLLLVYRAVNGSGLEYNSDLLLLCYEPFRPFRSRWTGRFIIPRVKNKHAEANINIYFYMHHIRKLENSPQICVNQGVIM